MTSNLPIPEEAFFHHAIALGKTRSGKSSVMRLVTEHFLDAGRPIGIIDPKGDWWGIKSSADGKRAGYPVVIFGGEHGDVPINAHAGAHVAELVATGNRPFLIDLGGWMVGERTRFFIDFASTLFRLTRGRRWLVIDECHNFAPQGKILDPDAGKMLHWANRLLSEAGGKGLTVISASQRPQKVHKDYLTCHETLIAMRVIHNLDRGAVKDWIDGCEDQTKGREVLVSLASMRRGEAWVWCPEAQIGPVRVQFPMFKTYDSFKPQDADAPPTLSGWAAVDLEDVKARLGQVIEEAAKSDPAALRKRIAELEGQVKQRAPAGPSQAEIEAARSDGYRDGLEDGKSEGRFGAWSRAANDLHALDDQVHALIDGVHKKWSDEIINSQAGVTQPAERRPSKSEAAGSSPAARSTPPRVSNGPGEKMPGAERKILTALAQYPEGRAKNQVAVLTGYAVNGGGFNNALSSLRTKGWIEGAGHLCRITHPGRIALGSYEPLPTGRALQDYWLAQLAKAERAILSALISVYPSPLDKVRLGERTGYEPGGGGFNNALSRLRTLDLIHGRGELRASDEIF